MGINLKNLKLEDFDIIRDKELQELWLKLCDIFDNPQIPEEWDNMSMKDKKDSLKEAIDKKICIADTDTYSDKYMERIIDDE